jgi:hypothetical protein
MKADRSLSGGICNRTGRQTACRRGHLNSFHSGSSLYAIGFGSFRFTLPVVAPPQLDRSVAPPVLTHPVGRRSLLNGRVFRARTLLLDKLPGNPEQDFANRSPSLLRNVRLRHVRNMTETPCPKLPQRIRAKVAEIYP